MITYSIVIFVIAGVLGIGLFLQIMLNKEVSKMIIFIHLLCAIVGMVLLTFLFMNNPHDLYWILGLFWVVAILGISNLAVYSNKGKPSKWMAFFHGAFGFGSLAALVIYQFIK